MHNILVTGASGQLGSELQATAGEYDYVFHFKNSKSLDITNHKLLEQFVIDHNINVIINCAAYTAVDKAESEPEIANAINHLAVKHMSEVAKAHQIKLVHISTDYVFDGTNNVPYKPEDEERPLGVYGYTKYMGEQAMLNSNVHGIIIRTSWLYSKYGNNFVKTMIKLGKERKEIDVITDQVATPTHAKSLAGTILQIINQQKLWCSGVEIFHYSNQGVCSWYDFASAIMRIKNIECKVNPIATKDYQTKAKRPIYTVMDKSKLMCRFNVEIQHWRVELQELLEEF